MTRPCDSDTVDAARGRWVPDGPEDSDHDDSQVSLLRRFKSPLPGSLALKQQSLALQKTESDSNRLVNRAYPGPGTAPSQAATVTVTVLAAAADSDSDS